MRAGDHRALTPRASNDGHRSMFAQPNARVDLVLQRHQLWNIQVGNLRDRLSAMAFQKINDTAAKGNIIK